MTVDDEEAALDRAFEAVADGRRRAVLGVLRSAPRGTLEIATLADAVAKVYETDPDPVATSLSECHLPKLDDAGVVDYREDEGVVAYDPDPLVERCLDVAQRYRSVE